MLGRERLVSCVAAMLLIAPAFAQSSYPQSQSSQPQYPQSQQPQQRPPQYDQQNREQEEWRAKQLRRQRDAQRQQERQRQLQQSRPPQKPSGHAGDWLRRYKDLPPQQQLRALENDYQFRRLPLAQQ